MSISTRLELENGRTANAIGQLVGATGCYSTPPIRNMGSTVSLVGFEYPNSIHKFDDWRVRSNARPVVTTRTKKKAGLPICWKVTSNSGDTQLIVGPEMTNIKERAAHFCGGSGVKSISIFLERA